MAFLTEYMTILSIHFGLILLESTLDSYGHDLWKIYNVINLSWTIIYANFVIYIYFFLLMYFHAGFSLVHSGVTD